MKSEESLYREKTRRLTRRQSQRRDLSRVVQKWLPRWSPQERHASRQVPSWLIFDVGQNQHENIAMPHIFVGISGVGCDVAYFDLGHGVSLRTTYAHLMAPFMVAFSRPEKQGQPHPPPWAAASGGFGFDVAIELSVPSGADSSLPYEATTVAWWLIALIRLRVGPRLQAPVLSNHRLEKDAASFRELRIHPLEVSPRQVVLDPEAKVTISESDLEWTKTNWASSLNLLTESPKFSVLLESVDQAAFHHSAQLAMLTLWTGLEEMFSPSKSELRYRVSSLIASYLEPPGKGRLVRQKAIAKLYDSRSAAAHGRNGPKSEALWETYDLVRQVVMKIIDEKHAPNAVELEERLFGAEP
jgi:hypothetical protein